MIPILTDQELKQLASDYVSKDDFREEIMKLYNITQAEYDKMVNRLMPFVYRAVELDRRRQDFRDSAFRSRFHHERVGVTIGDLKYMEDPDQFLKDNYS